MVRMHAQAALRGSTFQVASKAGGWVRRSVSSRPRAFLAPVRTTSPQWVGSRGLILGRAGLRVAVTPLRWKPPSLSARREYSLSPQAVVTPVPQKTGSNLLLSSQEPFNPTTPPSVFGSWMFECDLLELCQLSSSCILHC